MKHISIPLFVPHAGCPQQCIFCNQRTITGRTAELTPDDAKRQIETVLSALPKRHDVEIAFFGGSFTAIEQSKMTALLACAQPYISSGQVSGIRISTRPDAIDSNILDLLEIYHVGTIELGIQSMSDKVLSACRRGHSAADSRCACEMIISRHFTLGGQMMVGLPDASVEDEIATARAIVSMGAKEARIYPTVVFSGTELCHLMHEGDYQPLTLSEAVDRTCNALEILEAANIRMLRVGLCESEGLHKNDGIVGGAFHPAMGELCQTELYRRIFLKALSARSDLRGKRLTISVAPRRLSAAIGQHRSCLNELQNRFSLSNLTFRENQRLSGYQFEISAESEFLCD